MKERLHHSNEAIPESIAAAALLFAGQLYQGNNHLVALGNLKRTHPTVDLNEVVQGFVTSKGRFVSREEAARIAEAAQQVKPNSRPNNLVVTQLDSHYLPTGKTNGLQFDDA